MCFAMLDWCGGWPGLADGYEADRAPNSVSVLLYFVAAWVLPLPGISHGLVKSMRVWSLALARRFGFASFRPAMKGSVRIDLCSSACCSSVLTVVPPNSDSST